ncbi:roadblock/LC7 domain-containing protein [bacterium]|nr:roadblock/LC7 domain-containing protein [bacterium]
MDLILQASPSAKTAGLVSHDGILIMKSSKPTFQDTNELEFQAARLYQFSKAWWDELDSGPLKKMILSGKNTTFIAFPIDDDVLLFIEALNTLNLNWVNQNISHIIAKIKKIL